MNALFTSVGKAIESIQEDYGVLPGSILVFQSHGVGLAYKPHIHCILTAGGITKENKWEGLGSISYKRLTKVVQENLYKELKKKIKEEKLPKEEEIDEREWKVYVTYYQDSGEKIVGYVSHTACGVVINMNQEFKIDKEKGTIGFKENHNGKVVRTELRMETFVERYMNHIPPEHSVTVRYYGLYSNQNKGKLEELQKEFPVVVNDEEEGITDYCPNCHSPMITIEIVARNVEVYTYKEIKHLQYYYNSHRNKKG